MTNGIRVEGNATTKLNNVTLKNCNSTGWNYPFTIEKVENSTFENFTIGGRSWELSATSISYSQNIFLNNFTNVRVRNYGLLLDYTNYTTFRNSEVRGRSGGSSDIRIDLDSNHNTIQNAIFTQAFEPAIVIGSGDYNMVDNATILNLAKGGIHLFSSNNNLSNVFISNPQLTNYPLGFYISGGNFNYIINSSISDMKDIGSGGGWGVGITNGQNNTITGLTILNNSYGITLAGTTTKGNKIYNNLFMNNTVHFKSSMTSNKTNYFNTTKTDGTNIMGRRYIGGNFWSGLSGIDTDGDGFWDSPYLLNETYMIDYLPLNSTSALPFNNLPTINSISLSQPSTCIVQNSLLQVNISATDTEVNPIYYGYKCKASDPLSPFTPSNTIYCNYTSEGTFTLSVHANDTFHNGYSNLTQTVKVLSTCNSLPIITAVGISDCCISPESLITFTIYAIDPENDTMSYSHSCFDGDPMTPFNTTGSNRSCYYGNEGTFTLIVFVNDTRHTSWNSYPQTIVALPDITGVCGGTCIQTNLIDMNNPNNPNALLPQLYFGSLAFFKTTLSPMLILGMAIFFVLIMITLGVIIRKIMHRIVQLAN
jgi:nitrous oxidase accessory protein NosD